MSKIKDKAEDLREAIYSHIERSYSMNLPKKSKERVLELIIEYFEEVYQEGYDDGIYK